MLRWLIGLAELIWYKETCEVHYIQRYIFKRSELDSVGGGGPILYLEVTGECCSNGRCRNAASLNHI